MANSQPDFPVSSAKRRVLFGGELPPTCGLPVVDDSAGRYSTENRKPVLIQASRGLYWNTNPWITMHQAEFRSL